MAGLQTEFEFVLPKGLVDSSGTLHRRGTMRLATARDEIEPLRDQRISDSNDPFLTVIVLSRVITGLGTLQQVTTRDIEGLFAADLAFLQDFYGIVNFGTPEELRALQASVDTGAPASAPTAAPAAPAEAEPAEEPDDPAPVGRSRAAIEEVKPSGEG
jgi:hypothetical protein